MKKQLIYQIIIATFFCISGCKPTYYYVDQKNTTGPWDGSKKHPFLKIQDGLNKATEYENHAVVVYGGAYHENLTMKPGTTLQRAKNTTTVVIIGKNNKPTIFSKGLNNIYDLQISDGSVGIQIEIGAILNKYDQALTIIGDNLILSKYAIQIKTTNNLDFGTGNRKTPKVSILRNWIHPFTPNTGTGIQVDLIGPKTGELGLQMTINDNIIQDKSTGIELNGVGQGPNPGGFVRANNNGEIHNNLIIDNYVGIGLTSKNLGDAGLLIMNNTIANSQSHGILVNTEAGVDGDASTHPNITNNIIVNGKAYGYCEFNKKTSASDLQHNLFYNNNGHYFDWETSLDYNTQKELNTPIVNNKVIFYYGIGNIVADPKFETGILYWNGNSYPGEKAGDYFLTHQGSNKSPAIDAGFGTAQQSAVSTKSTNKNYTKDTGKADIGFHYLK